MRIADMNWMQVEAALKRDPRVVVPVGSTEQHGYLSLSVDAILAERVACEAAAPLAVPVFRLRLMDATAVREYIGDGSFGGAYQMSDEQMMRVWQAGVEETRAALEGPWT